MALLLQLSRSLNHVRARSLNHVRASAIADTVCACDSTSKPLTWTRTLLFGLDCGCLTFADPAYLVEY